MPSPFDDFARKKKSIEREGLAQVIAFRAKQVLEQANRNAMINDPEASAAIWSARHALAFHPSQSETASTPPPPPGLLVSPSTGASSAVVASALE